MYNTHYETTIIYKSSAYLISKTTFLNSQEGHTLCDANSSPLELRNAAPYHKRCPRALVMCNVQSPEKCVKPDKPIQNIVVSRLGV